LSFVGEELDTVCDLL